MPKIFIVFIIDSIKLGQASSFKDCKIKIHKTNKSVCLWKTCWFR